MELREAAEKVQRDAAAEEDRLGAESGRCRRAAELLAQADEAAARAADLEGLLMDARGRLDKATSDHDRLLHRQSELALVVECADLEMRTATDVTTEVNAKARRDAAHSLLAEVENQLEEAQTTLSRDAERFDELAGQVQDMHRTSGRLRDAAEDVLSGETERRAALEAVRLAKEAARTEEARSARVAAAMLGLPDLPPGEPGQPVDSGWVGLPTAGGRKTWARLLPGQP